MAESAFFFLTLIFWGIMHIKLNHCMTGEDMSAFNLKKHLFLFVSRTFF